MDYKAIFVTALFMGVFVLVPIIAILTEHQRKMARIMRGEIEDVEALKAENHALRTELAELKGEPLPPPRTGGLTIGLHVSDRSRRHLRRRGI